MDPQETPEVHPEDEDYVAQDTLLLQQFEDRLVNGGRKRKRSVDSDDGKRRKKTPVSFAEIEK